jgi:hypothetical protein
MTYGAQVETPAPSIVRSVELGGNCSPGFVVAKM